MGNLYRFAEPVLLLLLERKGQSYGYELASELPQHALTDSPIEAGALYKTLRQLEENGCVCSHWDREGAGPAKRVYSLTPLGREHLDEWVVVLGRLSKSMARFVRAASKTTAREPAPERPPKRAQVPGL
jgi:PadR family transcriptional regulator, regulatory protein PadR